MSEARSAIGNLMRAANGDADAAAQMLASRNPKFAEFMRRYQNTPPEQIAREHGIDLNQLRNML